MPSDFAYSGRRCKRQVRIDTSETLGRRQREIGHILPGSQSTHHEVSAQIVDHHHIVDCHCRNLHLVLPRTLPVIGQGVLWFPSSPRNLFAATSHPELEVAA
jgi:hypothetical protein